MGAARRAHGYDPRTAGCGSNGHAFAMSTINALIERVIGSECSLIRLHCEDVTTMHGQLRQHSMRTGQSLYAWTGDAGLRSLRDEELLVPGCRRFADALRYVAQSAHFGIYFASGYTQPLDPALFPLLKQIGKLGGERVRRVVLLDPTPLPAAIDAVELTSVAGAGARPQLRDGRWIRA